MSATVPSDIIELVVEHAFSGNANDYGVWDNDLLQLCVVSRAFLYSSRRALYEHVRLGGGDRFALLVGQLRFCPHLAQFVRRATLVSACQQQQRLADADADAENERVGARTLAWFLDACPSLHRLALVGPDFVPALSSRAVARSPGAARVRAVELRSCGDHACAARLPAGWLAPIVALPSLASLVSVGYAISQAGDVSRSTCCTRLHISSGVAGASAAQSVLALVAAMPCLRELRLEIPALPRGALSAILLAVAPTLSKLVLVDVPGRHIGIGTARDNTWDTELVSLARLEALETLVLRGMHISSEFHTFLPARLRRLVVPFSTALVSWLQQGPVHASLKILETESAPHVVSSSGELAARLRLVCAHHGIAWKHREIGRDEHEYYPTSLARGFVMPSAHDPDAYFAF